jgi:hypothetical protein
MGPSAAMTSEKFTDALNGGILRTIQTSGRTLPSSAVSEMSDALAAAAAMDVDDPPYSSSSTTTTTAIAFQCQWIEYATDLCDPVIEDIRACLSSRMATTSATSSSNDDDVNGLFGTDGRPLLYNACLGLLLSSRGGGGGRRRRRLRERDGNENDDENEIENDDEDENDEPEIVATPLSTFLSIARFLLDEMGVDPDQRTRTIGACSRPSLHLLARACIPEAVTSFLDRNARRDARDAEGWTACMACCMPDTPSYEDGGPSEEDRVNTLRALLNARGGGGGGGGEEEDDGNDGRNNIVDARNYCAYTALHCACEGLNNGLIKCLLEEGNADVSLRTIWGQSCLGIIRSRRRGANAAVASECESTVLEHLRGMKDGRMARSILSFFEEENKAMRITDLVNDVLIPASRRPVSDDGSVGAGLDAQDRRIVTALVGRLDVDPSSVYDGEDFRSYPHEGHANLYEMIHKRVMANMPAAYVRVYRSTPPTNEEREIVTCANYGIRKSAQVARDGVRRIDTAVAMRQSFLVHRERGHVARQLEILNDLIVGPLQRTFGFGIPSNDVAREIARLAPRIVDMGAGTGYWSYVLSRMGADVVAYDVRPTGDAPSDDPNGRNDNEYFGSQSYYPVREGDASTVFGDDVDPDNSNRALLLVWPNNPDADDNRHVMAEGPKLPEIWDLSCLKRYHRCGGNVVIYAGERETKIELMKGATGPDCGFCSSRKFQIFLAEHYELVAEFECPRWWMKEDDVTVWKRK